LYCREKQTIHSAMTWSVATRDYCPAWLPATNNLCLQE
jgi:hypothetical protein